jgi:hypothetical protein
MKRSLLAAAACGVMLVVCLGARGGAQSSPPPLSSPFDMSILFDGGYAFILGKQGNVTIGSFKTPHEGHGSPSHKMIMRLTRGKFIGGKKPSNTLPMQWDLNGYDIEPAQYGDATGAVVMPPVAPGAPACADNPNYDVVGEAANLLSYFPNITTLGGSAVDSRPERYLSRVTLSHGRLVLRRAAGCWEYRNSKDTVIGSRQPLAAGHHSLKYNLRIPGKAFTFRLTKVGGGSPETIVVEPEWVEETKDWAVGFWVGHFGGFTKADVVKVGQPMKHFTRFYTLLEAPPSSEKMIQPHKQHTKTDTAPGDECSLGLFVQ